MSVSKLINILHDSKSEELIILIVKKAYILESPDVAIFIEAAVKFNDKISIYLIDLAYKRIDPNTYDILKCMIIL